ncbi:hypothetical protein I3J09_08890 [Streptomyces clavuligerus]|nr:hypothetical protein D1794_09105 [Streptomyces clavuligerus]MBY6302794.1 hypothetical protein [Streptomyces clavuligerus]QCS09252.1 hypothetical protein CRV15_08535 [Streptomyces clavuligerus]QPJ96809.1 hypothetical protein GE265_19395 [Streptomyces clavuligerus]QPL66499.1 hypothetical protein I3J04_08875 [Streptomyces clavuligerus]
MPTGGAHGPAAPQGPDGTNGAGLPTGGPAAAPAPGLPGAGARAPGSPTPAAGIPPQGQAPVIDPLTAPVADVLAEAAGGQSSAPGLPYFSDAPQNGFAEAPRDPFADAAGNGYAGAAPQPPVPGGPVADPARHPAAPPVYEGTPPLGTPLPGEPTGATSGPAKGSMPIRQRMGAGASAADTAAAAVGTAAPAGPGAGGTAPGGPGGPVAPSVPGGPLAGAGISSGADAFGAVAAPGAGAGTGAPGSAGGRSGRRGRGGSGGGPGAGSPQGRVSTPRMSDDTAVLTPQKPAPAPGPEGQVSGDTLTSGLPAIQDDRRPGKGPRGPRSQGDRPANFPGGPGAATAPGAPGPAGPSGPTGPGMASGGTPAAPKPQPGAADALPAAPRPPQPVKKKGRSKLVLLGVAVFVLGGVAYGAGLLLNHSEVPKRTTVLGVDIGGGTKDQAIAALEKNLGERAGTPLRVSVDGKEHLLAPDKAGLDLDRQATVRKAAGSDYNPVSVIGSLFGGERAVQPVFPVDEEKLSVALADLAGKAGSAVEGTITFSPNKVNAVPGRAGESLDVARSVLAVKDAYRAQVESGRSKVVELPVAKKEPTVGQAELDRAMKEFAEPAMSANITVVAGGRTIELGPAISLPQILSMKAVDGKLVEVYDKKAIEQLVGDRFAGVTITKGDGKQHQLGPDDIAQAMGPALRGKTPAERTAEIDLG